MKIALVHSFYRSELPSGENRVVVRQVDALQAAGHEVKLFARHTDKESEDRLYELKAAFNVATGFGSDPTTELRHFGPDVVHVHNLFPNFGTRWLRQWDGPVVATLHNFRALCASGTLYRDGNVCMDCVGNGSRNALKHACYHDSMLATLPLAIRNLGGVGKDPLINRADRVIVLSDRSRRIYSDAGGDTLRRKLVAIPNGVADRFREANVERRHWCFVGRLSEEKGVRELLRDWPPGEPLIVVGDGPLREELEQSAGAEVCFAGVLDEAGVDGVLRSSWGMVFPSRCFEGFPTVVTEALMHATPVLSRSDNSAADFVMEHGAGTVYMGDGIPGKLLEDVRGADPTLTQHCRQVYLEQLDLRSWTDRLIGLFNEARQSDG